MSESVTFNDSTNRFTISCKKEFLERCPEPSKFDTHELNSKYFMFKYLHNEKGPAVLRRTKDLSKTERYEFWIDGMCLNSENPELAKKMEHDLNFNNKLESKLEE